ncbi:phospholipid scramblase 3 [Alligator mississippiensis]|uniref:Phospholipid scramblase n=1 Tax=Alligator mississippiensis TaxID=8496 RepID=A0A151NJP2_ALLMI|nr:phospholipid scramblase 3 [Alligator mississippiensis]
MCVHTCVCLGMHMCAHVHTCLSCLPLQTNLVLIRQQVELVEALLGFETRNRYTVQSGEGRPLFQAMEKSHLCARLCCGTRRSLHLELADRAGRPCLLLCRPLRCAACFCPCCLQELEVQCPPGTTLGHVVQTWHPMIPKFSVLTADRDPVLRIVGPCLACACGGDVHFEVKTTDESRGVGRISKQWGGLLQEALTDVDTFGVQFPLDLDVKVKATLLGACFLIDLMFFEKTAAGPQPSSVLSP